MSIIKIIKAEKELHKDSIILTKIGSFYHAYGRDAYILSYLFGYKLKQVEKDYITCGFPANSVEKAISALKEKQIDYIVLDKGNNYEVEEKITYQESNSYRTIYEKARLYVNIKTRIDSIYNYLEESIFDEGIKELLFNIEDLIDEKRKF